MNQTGKEKIEVEAEQLKNIPGTRLRLDKMDNAAGLVFLNKVFFITDRIMLAQIKEITGIDGTTLQNWLKRGWVGTPDKKSYTIEHLARILLINMMRDTMQLAKIAYVLEYINGNEPEDAIIKESKLYDYVCTTFNMLVQNKGTAVFGIDGIIEAVISDYTEPVSGAKRRLAYGIKIIVTTYYSAIIRSEAEAMVESISTDKIRKK